MWFDMVCTGCLTRDAVVIRIHAAFGHSPSDTNMVATSLIEASGPGRALLFVMHVLQFAIMSCQLYQTRISWSFSTL